MPDSFKYNNYYSAVGLSWFRHEKGVALHLYDVRLTMFRSHALAFSSFLPWRRPVHLTETSALIANSWEQVPRAIPFARVPFSTAEYSLWSLLHLTLLFPWPCSSISPHILQWHRTIYTVLHYIRTCIYVHYTLTLYYAILYCIYIHGYYTVMLCYS